MKLIIAEWLLRRGHMLFSGQLRELFADPFFTTMYFPRPQFSLYPFCNVTLRRDKFLDSVIDHDCLVAEIQTSQRRQPFGKGLLCGEAAWILALSPLQRPERG